MAIECKCRVLMLPWLAHSHVTPFVELGKKLHQLGHFHVYLCSTPVIIQQQKDDSNDDEVIEYVELELPSDVIPSKYQTTRHCPTHLMPNLKAAFDRSEPAFDWVLRCRRPDLVIYDFLQPWAPAVSSRHGIPSILFVSTSAITLTILYKMKISHPSSAITEQKSPFVGLKDNKEDDFEWHKMSTYATNGHSNGDRVLQCIQKSSSFVLIRSFKEIESQYLSDLCSLTVNKQIIPVGPLVKLENHNQNSTTMVEWKKKYTDWLDGKKKSSVVFASFGSEYFMSKDQIFEVAQGLELSQVNFVFVVRFPLDSRDQEDQEFLQHLLDDYSERGLIVEGWAPQKLILGHPNVGGFMTHCGWGSVMEAMTIGVPIIAMPMQLDQPFNARLVSQLGLGVEVRREDKKRADAIYGREEVARKIKLVMGRDDQEGLKIRTKVKEMAEYLGQKGDEHLEIVVNKLVEVCHCSRRLEAVSHLPKRSAPEIP